MARNKVSNYANNKSFSEKGVSSLSRLNDAEGSRDMYYPGVALVPNKSVNSDNVHSTGGNVRDQRKLSLPDIKRNKLRNNHSSLNKSYKEGNQSNYSVKG